ncbi:MAG TPA: hypothetical protein VFJ06_14310 [Halococcus sp.]|nr:hypothetical protein [Halococcus sp.]
MDRAPFDIGEPVVDRDSKDDDPNTAIIVNCPPRTANDWNAYRDTTVAEDNPEYPEDAPIAVVVYRDVLAEFDLNWTERDEPFSLAEFNEAGISHYSFPAPRLKSRESEKDSEADDTTDDADADESGHEGGNTTDTTESDNASTDENEPTPEGSRETESEPESEDEDGDEPASEPPAAVLALKETLADRGMTAEIEANGQTITTEKLGVIYRVKPGEVIDGDGPHRDQIEQIVAEA